MTSPKKTQKLEVVVPAPKCNAGEGKGWACPREAEVSGKCYSHYQQARRGTPLEPLRPRGLVRFSAGPRVSEEAAAVIEERAKRLKLPPYQVISRVLEAWARLPVKERASFAGLDDNRRLEPEE